jgi:hypothetical protein
MAKKKEIVKPLTPYQINCIRNYDMVLYDNCGTRRPDIPTEYDEGYMVPTDVWLATIDDLTNKIKELEDENDELRSIEG